MIYYYEYTQCHAYCNGSSTCAYISNVNILLHLIHCMRSEPDRISKMCTTLKSTVYILVNVYSSTNICMQ